MHEYDKLACYMSTYILYYTIHYTMLLYLSLHTGAANNTTVCSTTSDSINTTTNSGATILILLIYNLYYTMLLYLSLDTCAANNTIINFNAYYSYACTVSINTLQ